MKTKTTPTPSLLVPLDKCLLSEEQSAFLDTFEQALAASLCAEKAIAVDLEKALKNLQEADDYVAKAMAGEEAEPVKELTQEALEVMLTKGHSLQAFARGRARQAKLNLERANQETNAILKGFQDMTRKELFCFHWTKRGEDGFREFLKQQILVASDERVRELFFCSILCSYIEDLRNTLRSVERQNPYEHATRARTIGWIEVAISTLRTAPRTHVLQKGARR